jgi:hypothetical protein
MEVDVVSTNENDANEANAICLKSFEYSMSSERTFNYVEEPLLGRKNNRKNIEINRIF